MSFDKFRVLTWKNWTLQKRRPFAGALQIVFPILVILIFTWARNVIGNELDLFRRTEDAQSFELANFTACTGGENVPLTRIFFAPNSLPFIELMQDAFGSRFAVEGHPVFDLDSAFINSTEQSVAVILSSESSATTVLPSAIKYEIYVRYYSSLNCEIMIQNEIEKAFIKKKTDVTVGNAIVREFPYDDIFVQIFTELMTYVIPFFLVISTFTTVSGVIKSVSSEQKSKVKELMKIMGLSRTIHWLSWYLKWIIMSLFSYIIVTIFLCVPIIGDDAIFERSNFILILLLFFFYCSSVITFCFLISVLFQRAPSVNGVGVTVFFVTYVPYYVYGSSFDSLAYIIKWLVCLPVNTSMGVAISIVLNLEANREGLGFSNIFSHVEGFGFSFGEVLCCLILSTVIHILITVYIEMVFPGEIGIPKPWYFPIQSCLRLIRKDKTDINVRYSNGSIDAKAGISFENFEEEPKHLHATVKIENLTKYFGPNIAVNNLSLNMYQDQIFVLCGHNGAGKTTAMNMLIGMVSPSSGTAYINGFDITTELNEARNSIGICPQQDILFNDLTVREHIIFFCKLKGMRDGKKIKAEVEKYIYMLGLRTKKNARSKNLSGGQKRRLSIANALCGQSTFVILDEPTSGLDVKARRKLWDLLIEEKKGRTILLSTHYMEEADVLSDRVAIMNEGKLKAIGTSYFLKKKFGSGYRLIIVKKKNCDSTEILNVLKSYAPDVKIESEEQAEVTFILSDEYLEKFDKIFKQLEDEADILKISSFGCSISTLEEVFLKVGVDQLQNDQNESFIKVSNPFVDFGKVSKVKLFFNQIYAMILKKFHYTRRNISPYIYLAFITIGLSFIFLYAPFSLEANFDLKLSGFIQTENSNKAPVQKYKSYFFSDQVDVTNLDPQSFISESFLKRNLKYEMGASFDTQPVSVWHNVYTFVYPTASIYALNFYHRAILQANCSECDIGNIRDPYMNLRNGQTTTTTTQSPDGDFESQFSQFEEITIYILFFFVLIYWPSIHIVMRIKERTTKSKLLQFISGANRFTYTMTNFLIDFGIFYAVACIVLGMVAAIGRSGFKTADDIILYLCIFACFGVNIIAWIYLITPLFKNPLAGESAASNISFGISYFYLVYSILYHGVDRTTVTVLIYKLIYNVGKFFAPFGLLDCYEKIQVSKYNQGILWQWSEDGIINSFVFMIIGAVIFMTLVLMNDFFIFNWIGYKFIYPFVQSWNKMPALNPTGDDDVQREIENVKNKNQTQVRQSHLILDGLSKSYGKNLAVNQLHVSVETAECFGILGVNGAGKTTTFKMMTGDETISSGEGFIHGFNFKNEIPKIYKKIGYCPQYDALLPDLSGRETLKIFCLLRGIPNGEIDGVILTISNELGFVKHLDKQVENFSGGNKRKLSTALALIGNLSLIFLDECSSGMDPKAKRQLWSMITKTRNAGRAVILTSHSMQECEALCTKLAIMVDGNFSCFGSIQHLKNKFAKGFVLTIKMAKRDDTDHLNLVLKKVTHAFPTAELKEALLDLLTFHINTTELKWSKVFEELAKMKREIGISDYTMTQSSLESVFLFFSKQGKRVVE